MSQATIQVPVKQHVLQTKQHVLQTEPDGLYALLGVPHIPRGFVIFVHNNFPLSPADYQVATFLQEVGFATLMVDFLTVEDEEDSPDNLDVDMIANRLDRVTQWATAISEFTTLPLAYFATGVGGAAALSAAAHTEANLGAICVVAGPEISEGTLETVPAPTMLIAPSYELFRLTCRRYATPDPDCSRKFVVAESGAEDGTIFVAAHSRDWFSEHLNVGGQ